MGNPDRASAVQPRPVPGTPRHGPTRAFPDHAFNAPTHFTRANSGPFLASQNPPNFGQTSPSPVASTGRRSGRSGTHLGATGGTQNTLAPNRLKTRPTLSRPSRTSTSS